MSISVVISIITFGDIQAQGFTNSSPVYFTTSPIEVNGTSSNAIYIGKGLNKHFSNISIGYQTLTATTSTATSNTTLGHGGLKNITSGLGNTAMGDVWPNLFHHCRS